MANQTADYLFEPWYQHFALILRARDFCKKSPWRLSVWRILATGSSRTTPASRHPYNQANRIGNTNLRVSGQIALLSELETFQVEWPQSEAILSLHMIK